tara:strand:- start:739 stop:1290 length:552 start_codon:yes stop_codon:yes gene_type:complete
MWWDILKNAKLSSKGKAGVIDTSDINIDIEDNECKKDFLDWFSKQYEGRINVLNGKIEQTKASFIDKMLKDIPDKEFCKLNDFLRSIASNVNRIEDDYIRDSMERMKNKTRQSESHVVFKTSKFKIIYELLFAGFTTGTGTYDFGVLTLLANGKPIITRTLEKKKGSEDSGSADILGQLLWVW